MTVHLDLQEKAIAASGDMDLYVLNNAEHTQHDKLLAANTAIHDLADGADPAVVDAQELLKLVPKSSNQGEVSEFPSIPDSVTELVESSRQQIMHVAKAQDAELKL